MQSKTLQTKALEFLARRDYSRFELAQRLKSYADDSKELNVLLDQLQSKGLLSDQRFTENWLYRKSSKYGTLKLQSQLREKGVPEEIANSVLQQAQASEFDRALFIWQKKFSHKAKDAKERAKQARFLQGRGFEFEVIQKIVF